MTERVVASAPSALSDTCLKIVRTLHEVQQWMKPAPLTMTSLANECLGLHETLTQGRDDMSAAQENQPQLVKTMEAFLLGCSMTVSVIDEYALELYEAVTLITSKTTGKALKADVRLLWKEEDMKELLSQTRGYQNRLRSLLDTFDKTNTLRQTNESALGNQLALITLLHRSHSSSETRPTSIRSSLRDSLISLDPSPPYALSLNGDATDAIQRITEDMKLFLSDDDSIARIDRSQSSLTGKNVPEETLASNEDDDLHEHEQPSKFRTPKTTPSPPLSVEMEEIDDDEIYAPMLADTSQTQIRNSEIGIALTNNSSNIKATVFSGAEIVAISTPCQLFTDTIEAAAPIANVSPVVVYTIAIAGSEDSGKTELMNWFLHRGLEQEVPSMEENGKLCKIDDANVVVDIIDNTGQELYQSMRYNYISRAEGYLLVYKASSRASFEEAQQIQLVVSGLIQERDEYDVLNQPALLVAHNVESEAERQVSHREGQSLADFWGCTFVETSGKDHSSFEKATYDMIRLIRRQYAQYVRYRQYTPDYDLYGLSDAHPAVAKMMQDHAFFKRVELHLANKMFRDTWRRKRG